MDYISSGLVLSIGFMCGLVIGLILYHRWKPMTILMSISIILILGITVGKVFPS